ncbi:MAG: Ig-like domain-containing protein, partial [Planctomycetota bacterium]
MADWTSGLQIIDITDPPAASIVHSIDTAALGGNAQAVATAAGLAFVGTVLGEVVAVDMVSGVIVDRASLGVKVEDLFIEGEVLYALTQGALYTLPLLDTLEVLGSAPSPGGTNTANGRQRLFVGGGVAYAVHRNGYNTIDVSDTAAPALITATSLPQFGWKQIVLNGSGLGLAAASPNQAFDGAHDVWMYDTLDPAVTDAFITAFPTPGVARSVSIFNGLVYTADHGQGLQVINYLPYDALGVAPEVSLATSIEGSQVQERSLVIATVEVVDDVQVRNVQLLINGEVVQTDGNYPFQFYFETPALADPRGSEPLAIVVRATDTGGNVTESIEQVYELVPDIFPPVVTEVTPGSSTPLPDGLFENLGITVRCSEALDPASVSADSVEVRWAGPDGTFETRDDEILAPDVSLVQFDRWIVIAAQDPPEGLLRLTVDGDAVTDLAGNPLDGDDDGQAGGALVVEYEIFESPYTKFWVATTNGSWHEPQNWSEGTLPGASDLVLIDVPGEELEIAVSEGGQICGQLLSREALTLTGGSLTVASTIQVDSTFSFNGGTLIGATVVPGKNGEMPQFSGSNANILNGVTLNGDVTLGGSQIMRVQNGLTLNGTVTLAASAARMLFQGDQALGGAGEVHFANPNGTTYIRNVAPTTLTIGAGVLVHGGRANIGQAEIVGGPMTVVNEGTLRADSSSTTITVDTNAQLANASVIEATSGGTLRINGGATGDLGTAFVTLGGHLDVDGTYVTNERIDVFDGSILTLRGTWSNTGTITMDGSTVNLGGTFTLAELGSFNRTGGTVNLIGTLNNTVLILDAATGTWRVDTGTILGGTVNLTEGSTLEFSGSNAN